MSFTAACYTPGCGWKKKTARDAAEALRWGQWHTVEMKLKTGRRHDTNISAESTVAPRREPSRGKE